MNEKKSEKNTILMIQINNTDFVFLAKRQKTQNNIGQVLAELMTLLWSSCRPVGGADRRQQPKPVNLDVAAADGTLALPRGGF